MMMPRLGMPEGAKVIAAFQVVERLRRVLPAGNVA